MYVDMGDELKTNGRDSSNNFTPESIVSIESNIHEEVLGIADSYSFFAVPAGTPVRKSFTECIDGTYPSGYSVYEDCILDWRKAKEVTFDPSDYSAGSDPSFEEDLLNNIVEQNGRPILLIDFEHMASGATASGAPRLVSLGPNGRYDPPNCVVEVDCDVDDFCKSDVENGDIVLCLR